MNMNMNLKNIERGVYGYWMQAKGLSNPRAVLRIKTAVQ